MDDVYIKRKRGGDKKNEGEPTQTSKIQRYNSTSHKIPSGIGRCGALMASRLCLATRNLFCLLFRCGSVRCGEELVNLINLQLLVGRLFAFCCDGNLAEIG